VQTPFDTPEFTRMYKGKITMSNVLLCIFFVSIDLVYHFLVITLVLIQSLLLFIFVKQNFGAWFYYFMNCG